MLRAAVITKEEYHLLFYFLETVSEASEALTERMKKYLDSGLLFNERKQLDEDNQSLCSRKILFEEEPQSILNELVQEGVLSQRDIEECSVNASEYSEHIAESCTDKRSSVSSTASNRKVSADEYTESVADSSIIETSDNVTTVTINGNCCTDHRISADVSDNVWANVTWHFLNPTDFGYDQIRSVKRSRSDSALTPVARRRNDDIYESMRDADRDSCGSITPYESIEDLYDCIKNSQYNTAVEQSSPSTESQSEPQYTEFYNKSSATRQSSTSSEKSAASSAFPFSKYGSSDSTGAFASCESTSGVSTFAPKVPESLKSRELPPTPVNESSESSILLRQLFTGELMDAYGEYLTAYPYARALLRQKLKRDEHFVALADIRRGAAKHSILNYLELPVSFVANN